MREVGRETIVVTGASSGIGRELARQLAGPGRTLWLVARNEDRLTEVADDVRAAGAEARVVVLDLADIDAAARFLEEQLGAGQSIDQLYLAAAVSLFGEVKDLLPEDWERLYRTDFLSCAQWLRAIYAGMVARRSGTIVIISSLSGYVGYPTSVPYAAFKAGLIGLFRSLRYEARQYGVHIHLVSPGYVQTGIFRAATYRRTSYERTMKQIEDLGFRMLAADRAAAAILKGVARGRGEIIFPSYARVMAWVAPRMPMLIRPLHSVMMSRFRRMSR